jgi:hypothetical protein
MVGVTLWGFRCLRCEHEWVPRGLPEMPDGKKPPDTRAGRGAKGVPEVQEPVLEQAEKVLDYRAIHGARALTQAPDVTVEIYPGETPPQELHVYLRVAEISDAPIFACVLAPPDVVRELASRPPHVVMESASLQFMDSDLSNAAITTAVEAWIRRLWPRVRVPTLRLSPWPGPVETGGGTLEILRLFPGEASFDAPLAPPAFTPPAGLVDQQFLLPRQAA